MRTFCPIVQAMAGIVEVTETQITGWLYRQRNAVERFFNKLKHFRAVAIRHDKRDDNYLVSIKLASLRIRLRFSESVA